MNSLFGSAHIDTFLSDPMLLIGASLFLIGVIVFLISLWKLARYKNNDSFAIPDDSNSEEDFSVPTVNKPMVAAKEEISNVVEEVLEEQSFVAPTAEPAPVAAAPAPKTLNDVSADETIVLPPGVADIQAQMNIIVTQLKQLNKKVSDIEDSFEDMSKQVNAKLDVNELKEMPMNPQDFTQKLLKLAEHVIVLEKEVAKIRSTSTAKMPIMPL